MRYAFAIPILPGKTEAARDFINTVLSSKSKEWADLQARQDVTAEYYFLQSSPDGDMMVVYGEGNWRAPDEVLDPQSNEFDAWFLNQVQDINGFDIMQIGTAPSELLGEWHAEITSDAPVTPAAD
jgi:hypothetical protein